MGIDKIAEISTVSERAIEYWKGSSAYVSKPSSYLFSDHYERPKDALQYKGGLKQAEVKAEARKAVADRIDEELMRLLGPVVLGAPEDLKEKFQVRSAADLIEGPRATFTGFFQNLVGKVDGLFWRKFGRTYCLKIARDFNLTKSRTDRFQLKDRLKKAVEKWDPVITGFGSMVAEIQSTYMK